MPTEKYIFQKRKASFTKKVFEKGLNSTAYILLALKESGEDFLKSLPDCYPQFALMKDMFGVRAPKFKKKIIRNNLYRLEKQGLVKQDPKEKVYYLTDKGEEFAAYIKNKFLILKEPWDGKLRLVIFDVPEEKKYWREIIRKELLLMQFQQLQKSVYVGKYPLSQSFCQQMEKAGVGSYVFIFTIEKADRHEEILKLIEYSG